MAGRATLRASDADREQVAERLRQAAAEGRLLTEELEQRLEAAFAARTYGQLNALVADLPGRQLTARAQTRELARVSPAIAIATAVVVALAVVAVVFVLTGVLAMWMLWLVAGWWFFGRHRRRLSHARYGRSFYACSPHRSRGRSRGFSA